MWIAIRVSALDCMLQIAPLGDSGEVPAPRPGFEAVEHGQVAVLRVELKSGSNAAQMRRTMSACETERRTMRPKDGCVQTLSDETAVPVGSALRAANEYGGDRRVLATVSLRFGCERGGNM